MKMWKNAKMKANACSTTMTEVCRATMQESVNESLAADLWLNDKGKKTRGNNAETGQHEVIKAIL